MYRKHVKLKREIKRLGLVIDEYLDVENMRKIINKHNYYCPL